MSGRLERIYARYSEVRPSIAAPKNEEELLRGQERVFRRVFGPWLRTNKDAKTLDVGCGYGEFLYFLQKEGYDNAAGIDRDPRQLEAARGLAVRNVRYGEARDVLLESSDRFDCISAIDLLEHIPKDEDLLYLVWGALHSGGALSVKCLTSPPSTVRCFTWTSAMKHRSQH
jgi:2-polyprenyl-3-methyl-5-hydroxy-6-metoxy-1,4-benzoquinol methylase